jgi:adenosylmethionine-8-amino-7-oxononanoate aminotransferase
VAAKKQRGRRSSHLVHAFDSPARIRDEGPVTLVKAQGIHVWDENGNKYIDGLASLWNVAAGHGRREIARAVDKQIRQLSYAPTLLGFSSPPAQDLARRIAGWAPGRLNHVAFTCGGSESAESVIRLARLYWKLRGHAEKTRFVALRGAYHGSTTGAATLTGLEKFHHYYEPLMPGVERMARPHCYRCELRLEYPTCALACADELEKTIRRLGADRIAAFIAEPVQGVGGVVVPPPGYFERIRDICDRHEILFVVDEVITGFGRTGKRFGIEHWKAVPDMLTFAKGVTSGHLPLGGVVLSDEIMQTLVDAGPDFVLHQGFTYAGHPVVCAAALANLDIFEREKLVARARRLGRRMQRALAQLRRHAIVGDVRGIGLMAALELVRDRAARTPFAPALRVPERVRAAALRRGAIIRASGDIVALCPPLVIGERDLDRLVGIVDAAIAEVAAELQR